MRTRTSQPRAFTLVELLIVIGIIAVLIGLLLPVISGIAARGRDLKCQTNLRAIVQAMHGYAAENKGAMPWGLVWRSFGEQTFEQGGDYTSWAGLVSTYMNRQGAGVDDRYHRDAPATRFSPALICPEAAQSRPHVVSYATNWIVCASPQYDRPPPGPVPGSLLRPARASHLVKDTALVFDAGIYQGLEHHPHFWVGADVDGERIWLGFRTPQWRYITTKDIFGRIPPGVYGHNRPVVLDVASYKYHNIEPGPLEQQRWPYQGNLRFRHRKDTTCNVGFADGSVRAFTARMNSDKTVKSHDALRRYFQLKWPSGVPADPAEPH